MTWYKGTLPKEEELKLGDKTLDLRSKVRIWAKCKECNTSFWSMLKEKDVGYDLCSRCVDTPGHEITIDKGKNKGKVYIRLSPDDPLWDMTMNAFNYFSKGWTAKARYLKAKQLGRTLESWEQVHHKDRNKNNFALDNLIIREVAPPTNFDAEPVEEPDEEGELL